MTALTVVKEPKDADRIAVTTTFMPRAFAVHTSTLPYSLCVPKVLVDFANELYDAAWAPDGYAAAAQYRPRVDRPRMMAAPGARRLTTNDLLITRALQAHSFSLILMQYGSVQGPSVLHYP